jgi:hypothetical protein
MDIFIQPVLDKMRQFGSSIHLRYLEVRSHHSAPLANGRFGKEAGVSEEKSGAGEGTSYVILRKEYSYLEPIVRSLFDEAGDVRVIVDRRWHERRRASDPVPVGNRRTVNDRRMAAPMLDILINVQA